MKRLLKQWTTLFMAAALLCVGYWVAPAQAASPISVKDAVEENNRQAANSTEGLWPIARPIAPNDYKVHRSVFVGGTLVSGGDDLITVATDHYGNNVHPNNWLCVVVKRFPDVGQPSNYRYGNVVQTHHIDSDYFCHIDALPE